MEEIGAPILLKDLGRMYPEETSKQKEKYGLYKCGYCGKEFKVMYKSIKKGQKSCGCQIRVTHNLTKHPLFKTWAALIHRCTNTNIAKYEYYGGRGIKVCEEWLDVKNFIEWAEATYIDGYTLDRINNDGNYEPDNCRWASKTIQCCNQRIRKDNTSGYVGIKASANKKGWRAVIRVDKVSINIGSFKTLEEAVQARDQYIIDNNLPHKLSKDYKENKNE
jgi:transcription antitermination factor NusG